MADPKSNDPKSTPSKSGAPADGKTGPVKPPVLDLTPNAASSSAAKASAAKADQAKSEPPKSEQPKPADKPAEPFGARSTAASSSASAGFSIGATLAGAILGLAAAYGLAFAGLWPSSPAATPTPDPRLAQFAGAIPELETVTSTTQSELSTLTRRVATLEAAPETAAPAGAVTDLGPVETELASLTERIDALTSQPATPADSPAVASLRTELASVTARLDEFGARLGSAEANVRDLDTSVAETSATLAQQPSDIGAVLQLPLILSGFEAAFSTGRPFEAELAALRAAAPDTTIPPALANAAPTGLPRPDVISQRFGDVLPAIIAGRPANPDAGWEAGAMDWFSSAIALRPTAELEGDTPEAIVSRLEGAMARRDFAAAQTLFDSLPAPMQSAAGDVPALVATQAAAAEFLDGLRTRALSGQAAS